jgi:hypothetical protein
MDDLMIDRLQIREVIEKWVLYSDSGDFERFPSVWHPDGYMSATWFKGTAKEFVEGRKQSFNKGTAPILHFIGGSIIDILGKRAIAQTEMHIDQRGRIDGVLVDVVCVGRFYDFLEKYEGRWLFVRRQPIYEKDRMHPADPTAVIKLDAELYNEYPEGFRNLAYLQTKNGHKVRKDLPGLKGPIVETLYAEGKAWLAGSARPGNPL